MLLVFTVSTAHTTAKLMIVLEREQLGCGRRRRVALAAFAVHPIFQLTVRHAAYADVADARPGRRTASDTLEVPGCLRSDQPSAGDRLAVASRRAAVVQLPEDSELYLHLQTAFTQRAV